MAGAYGCNQYKRHKYAQSGNKINGYKGRPEIGHGVEYGERNYEEGLTGHQNIRPHGKQAELVLDFFTIEPEFIYIGYLAHVQDLLRLNTLKP